MRFNVAALRAAIDAASDRLREQHADRERSKAEERETVTEQWLEQYAADWDRAALDIRKKVRKHWPVLLEDLPMRAGASRSVHEVAIFRPRANDEKIYEEPHELASLRAVLDTLAEDTVTAAGLRQLGISEKTMRMVVSHLSAKSVTN